MTEMPLQKCDFRFHGLSPFPTVRPGAALVQKMRVDYGDLMFKSRLRSMFWEKTNENNN